MVAGFDAHADDFVTFVIILPVAQTGAAFQRTWRRLAEVGWKPNRVRFVADVHGLFDIEDGKSDQFANGQFTVAVGDNMNIRIPGKPLTDAFQAGRNYDFGHLGNYRFTAFGE